MKPPRSTRSAIILAVLVEVAIIGIATAVIVFRLGEFGGLRP